MLNEDFVHRLKLELTTLAGGNSSTSVAIDWALERRCHRTAHDLPRQLPRFAEALANGVEDHLGYHGKGLYHDLNSGALKSWREDVIRLTAKAWRYANGGA